MLVTFISFHIPLQGKWNLFLGNGTHHCSFCHPCNNYPLLPTTATTTGSYTADYTSFNDFRQGQKMNFFEESLATNYACK